MFARFVALAFLAAPAPALAQYVRSYDFSSGFLPEEQGWGAEYGYDDWTRGSSPTPPTFEEGGMRSDTMGLPLSGTGHQWWLEYVPYDPWPPCVMIDKEAWWEPGEFYTGTGAYMEFEIKVIESTYQSDGWYVRTGWNGWFGDYWQTFTIGITDTGYLIGNELGLTVDTDTGGIRPFDNSEFHVYRLVADDAGAHLYIDGQYMETVPYGAELGEDYGYAYAVFGDAQGWLDGVNSDTIIRSFEYGCYPDNLAPLALDDVASGAGAQVIPVLINDTDPDGDPLNIASTTDPGYGTLTIDNVAGTITYTPDLGFLGVDTFTYTIVDGMGGSDTAEVVVEVGEELFVLDLVGSCPGWVDVNVSGLAPGEQFAIVRSDDFGDFAIPAGACAGTPTGLASPAKWVGRLAFWADPFGTFGAATLINGDRCDDVWRAVSLDSCAVSNLEQADL
ncbi:MAG: hypothetical protein ACI8PZ_003960 [Myxococcota bacterium]|jgi:hypothetical protein